jgi:hypothetical protein
MTSSAFVAFVLAPLAVLAFGLSIYLPGRRSRTRQG